MSNIDIVKKFAELLETRNLDALQAILADDCKAKGTAKELNKQQIIGYIQMLFTAFPDFSFGLTGFEEKGEFVTCISHEKGTHAGVLDLNQYGIPVSLPPTGKAIALPESTYTFRLADGKITYFSEEIKKGGGLVGALAQLGVELP